MTAEWSVEKVVEEGPKLSEKDMQQAREVWSKPLAQLNRQISRTHKRSTTNASTSTDQVVIDLEEDAVEEKEDQSEEDPEDARPAKRLRRACTKRGRSFPPKRRAKVWSRRRKESSKPRAVSDLIPPPPVDFDPKKLVQKSLRGFLASD